MGAEIAGATQDSGRQGGKARSAGASIEPQNAGGGEATSVGTVPGEKAGQAVARLRSNAGGRRVGRGLRDHDQPGELAEMADRRPAVASTAKTCGTSPRVACAAGSLWRTGA